jgi:hypothetical protein
MGMFSASTTMKSVFVEADLDQGCVTFAEVVKQVPVCLCPQTGYYSVNAVNGIVVEVS